MEKTVHKKCDREVHVSWSRVFALDGIMECVVNLEIQAKGLLPKMVPSRDRKLTIFTSVRLDACEVKQARRGNKMEMMLKGTTTIMCLQKYSN